MALERRIATVYRHEQVTPATTWTIVHNLLDYPIVDVYVMYGGDLQKIIPSAVNYIDNTTCTVVFTTAFAGYATVV
jgi:hypothetical protein